MWCSFFKFSLWYMKLYKRYFKRIYRISKNILDYFKISPSSYKKTASYLEAITFKSFNGITSANAPNSTL
ncbi:hypothetical protein CN340_16710 [Bacillus anthracis]|nr:hypothetical protein CN340_16710 [Bacillus anthracis]